MKIVDRQSLMKYPQFTLYMTADEYGNPYGTPCIKCETKIDNGGRCIDWIEATTFLAGGSNESERQKNDENLASGIPVPMKMLVGMESFFDDDMKYLVLEEADIDVFLEYIKMCKSAFGESTS